MKVILKSGVAGEFEHGTPVMMAAKELDKKALKKAVAAKVNGNVVGLRHPLVEGDEVHVELLTFEDAEGKEVYWHTSTHIMAQAVCRLYPNTKLAIGPAIENGFYYDMELEKSIAPEDFPAIEAEMNKIIKENLPIERMVVSREEAKKIMADQPYKLEMVDEMEDGEEITCYKQGEYVDLCRGPHLPSTGAVGAIKLTSSTGAYWRADANNKMLTRLYGISFPSKAELEGYLNMMEEAKKRDHRKIGKELDLYEFFEEGPGFPFFLPNGMILRNQLEDFWKAEHRKAGYQEIKTPTILNRKLWETSGHWFNYRENMYTTVIDEEDYAIKPMNCPGGMLVYNRKPTSYRELPIRMGELGLVHRHELSGALHGLMRVRNFTQDDAHIFMTEEQAIDEILGVIHLDQKFYELFGFEYNVELSTQPEKHMGSDEEWEMATQYLIDALAKSGLDYKINPGDGAFYGPKIDFHLKDSIGRTWQCGTIQLDMQMPRQFDLTYVGSDGEKHRPLMLHRTIFGSIERFIGILTEHFAGAFPLWLCPVQAMVIPISEAHHDYAQKVAKEMADAGIRVEADYRSEKMNAKIRDAQLRKIPYMLVVGDKEVEAETVSVRARNEERGGVKSIEQQIADMKKEIENKELR